MTTKSWLFSKRAHLAACAFALTGAAACDPDDIPVELLPANTQMQEGLQQVLNQAVAKPDIVLPGAITYYRDARHAPWTGTAGLGDVPARTPMRPGDRVRAGSIVKTFLAAVTLQHVEEGTLSLQQKMTELLPRAVTDQVPGAERITLRMLLNHTSGIPEWVTDEVHLAVAREPARLWTTEEALRLALAQPPRFEPGEGWSYSNTNYVLVGLALDRIGGSWRDQVRRRVIERLGLPATRLPEPGDRSMGGEYAHGYHAVDGTLLDLTMVDPSMAGAAGGSAMVTTVQDLARFLDALLAGRLFARPETLRAMTTMVDAPHESGLPHRYGLGLESFELGGTTVVGHNGGSPGYAVMMVRIPDRSVTLVTAVNTSDMFVNALHVLIPSVRVITGAKAQ